MFGLHVALFIGTILKCFLHHSTRVIIGEVLGVIEHTTTADLVAVMTACADVLKALGPHCQEVEREVAAILGQHYARHWFCGCNVLLARSVTHHSCPEI